MSRLMQLTKALALCSALVFGSGGLCFAAAPVADAAEPTSYVSPSKAEVPTAAAVREEFTRARTVRVGYTDFQSFLLSDSAGGMRGYGAELLTEIANHTGWNYEFVPGKFGDHLKAVQEGRLDLICNLRRTNERIEHFIFSNHPSGSVVAGIYARRDDSRYYYNDFEHFEGIRIGVVANRYQNTNLERYAQTHGFNYELVTYPSTKELFEALAVRDVDAVGIEAGSELKDAKLICQYDSAPFYFATNLKNRALMTSLNEALESMLQARPTLFDYLHKKYYSGNATHKTVVLSRREAQTVDSTPVLKVGVTPTRAPISYQDKDGNPAGIAVDMMQILSERTGLKFEYRLLPPGEAAGQYIRSGEIDMFVSTVSDTFGREAGFLHSDPLVRSVLEFAGRTSESQVFDNEAVIALHPGLQRERLHLQELFPKTRFISCEGNRACLEAVHEGRADLMLQDDLVLRHGLQSPYFADIAVLPYNQKPDYFVVKMGGSRLTLNSVINKGIATLTAADTTPVILRHTIGMPYKLTTGEIFYKYRWPIGLSVFFVSMLTLCLMSLIALRRRHMVQLNQTNAELKNAVERANRASDVKTLFLARMSQELLTPMNTIVTCNENTMKAIGDRPEVAGDLEKIDRASKLLQAIINDVLDMSDIANDKLKLVEKDFNLRQVLESITAIYGEECRVKGVALDVYVGLGHECLTGDSLRVSQIILNLVSNALKYTEPGGSVTIVVTEEDSLGRNFSTLDINVSDTGRGIDSETLTRIFHPFEQAAEDPGQARGGSGLGLSITKSLVELMHGEISVQSRVGEGSNFRVRIPMRVAEDNLDARFARLGHQSCVLVGTDAVSRDGIVRALCRIGVEYTCVEGADTAVDAIDNNPDCTLVMVDNRTADGSGLKTLQCLRERLGSVEPAVALTDYDTARLKKEAAGEENVYFISRPVFASRVVEVFEAIQAKGLQ